MQAQLSIISLYLQLQRQPGNKAKMELATMMTQKNLNSSENTSDVDNNSSANFNTSVLYSNESCYNESELSPSSSSPSSPSHNEGVRLMVTVAFSCLIVLGTYGNAFSFYIMRRESLKKASTCFYMTQVSRSSVT